MWDTWPNITTLPTHPLLPPGQYGQPVKHPLLLPGHIGYYERNLSMSSSHLDISFYNTADYYQTRVLFTQMVHQLAEDNKRSNLSTALESVRACNSATMLPSSRKKIIQSLLASEKMFIVWYVGKAFTVPPSCPTSRMGLITPSWLILWARAHKQSWMPVWCRRQMWPPFQEVNVRKIF